jgi:hypothetical protein
MTIAVNRLTKGMVVYSMVGNRGIDNPDPDPHLWIPHFPECFSAFSAILSVSLLFVLDIYT